MWDSKDSMAARCYAIRHNKIDYTGWCNVKRIGFIAKTEERGIQSMIYTKSYKGVCTYYPL